MLLTTTLALKDRCEVTQSCQESSENCPIRRNYPPYYYNGISDVELVGNLENKNIERGYDPKIDKQQNINWCIETICQHNLTKVDPEFKNFYFNKKQASLIINIQCWNEENKSCLSIENYRTVTEKRLENRFFFHCVTFYNRTSRSMSPSIETREKRLQT